MFSVFQHKPERAVSFCLSVLPSACIRMPGKQVRMLEWREVDCYARELVARGLMLIGAGKRTVSADCEMNPNVPFLDTLTNC